MIAAMQQTPPAYVMQAAAYPAAAPLIGSAGSWLNAGGGSPAIRPGVVTVLAFWTKNCVNCERTLPYWNGWATRYAGTADVAVLSVHTPETKWERDPHAIAQFARRRALRFPILIDNEEKNWDAYNVQAWPTTILIDKRGRIRNRWEGELNFGGSALYRQVAAQIEALRREKA